MRLCWLGWAAWVRLESVLGWVPLTCNLFGAMSPPSFICFCLREDRASLSNASRNSDSSSESRGDVARRVIGVPRDANSICTSANTLFTIQNPRIAIFQNYRHRRAPTDPNRPPQSIDTYLKLTGKK